MFGRGGGVVQNCTPARSHQRKGVYLMDMWILLAPTSALLASDCPRRGQLWTGFAEDKVRVGKLSAPARPPENVQDGSRAEQNHP